MQRENDIFFPLPCFSSNQERDPLIEGGGGVVVSKDTIVSMVGNGKNGNSSHANVSMLA